MVCGVQGDGTGRAGSRHGHNSGIQRARLYTFITPQRRTTAGLHFFLRGTFLTVVGIGNTTQHDFPPSPTYITGLFSVYTIRM